MSGQAGRGRHPYGECLGLSKSVPEQGEEGIYADGWPGTGSQSLSRMRKASAWARRVYIWICQGHSGNKARTVTSRERGVGV